MDKAKDIKTMQLYNHIERVDAELCAQYGTLPATLAAEELSSFDSLHYLGNEAVRNGISHTRLDSASKVLDVGSGLGGPARMLASLAGCSVTALELQPDLSAAGQSLTARCGPEVSSLVSHVCVDIMSEKSGVENGSYDAIVSWLVFLHIKEKGELFRQCFAALKDGGRIYVEDMYAKGEFTQAERESLKRDVYIEELQNWNGLKEDLEGTGFKVVLISDYMVRWTDYVSERLSGFKEKIGRHVSVHGERAVQDLLHFYSSVEALFKGGNLGGVVYAVEKVAT